MIRIAYIEEDAGIGGAQINLFCLLEALDKNVFRSAVVLPFEGPLTGRLVELGVQPHIIPRQKFISTSAYFFGKKILNPLALAYDILVFLPTIVRIRQFLVNQRIDVVHTNSMIAHIYGALAAKLAGIPCLWHMQDLLDSMLFGMVRWGFLKIASFLPTRIIAVSEAVAGMFKGSCAGKVRVIRNGTDTRRFTPGAAEDVLRSEIGIDRANFVVGIVGRLVRWKGHPEFLRASAIFASKVPLARFLIIGDATFGNDRYAEGLRRLSEELGLIGRVVFVGGRTDVPELMRLMDVLVHCSIEPEPFGLVLTEAMASGVPVIASPLGGPAEIVKQGVEGFLVDPKNSDELARAIMTLYENPALRKGMGESARRKAEKQFSIGSFVRAFAEEYKQVAVWNTQGFRS